MEKEKVATVIDSDERIKKAVRQTYGDIARRFVEKPAGGAAVELRQVSCCGPTQEVEETSAQGSSASCCGPSEEAVETAAGAASLYSGEELAGLPDSVTSASLGCGNPIALAGLKPGEVVLDLGSGGGIDCFLAAKRVGPEGRVIGLDMTPDMIKLARRNAKKIGAQNVDFRYGEMEEMPLPDRSVDVIISNCVVNLSPDKDAVFGEAFRVLRPGGRMMISDVVVDGELPASIREQLDAWAGCIAGALDESVYLDKIRAAGFERVEVVWRSSPPSEQAIEEAAVQLVVVRPGGPIEGEDAKDLLAEAGLSVSDVAHKVASIGVTAYKPL
jgi:arsenite methyltransferase